MLARAGADGVFGPAAPATGLVAFGADGAGDQLVREARAGGTGFGRRVGVRTPGGAVALAPLDLAAGPPASAAALPTGAGAVVAAPGAAGLRVATWAP
jgi:hypothetical protein